MSEIKISPPIIKDQTLWSQANVSNKLEKYLKQRELFIKYDHAITKNESILNIPLTATLLPLAWLTGANIYVDKIDKNFTESMQDLKQVFKKRFPKVSFSGEIIADELIENSLDIHNSDKQTGILFSGGVDSVYSLVTNLEKNPSLIMLWGLDDFSYPERADHWNKTIELYREYATRKKLDLYILRTNISQILNTRRIEHQYHKELYDGKVRMALQHSLIILPPVAPLSMGRFNNLIIAASLHPGHDHNIWPFAPTPETDEKIVWADLSVKHDGYIMRHEKFKAISDYLKEEDLTIRVCLKSTLTDGCLNDSLCEKCLIAIMNLAYLGVDPNKCGFKVDESTWDQIRDMWGRKDAGIFSGHWWELQEILPNKVETDVYGSQAFFEWFKNYKFEEEQRNWFFTDLYNSLPYPIAVNLDKIYRKLGINVHMYPWVR